MKDLSLPTTTWFELVPVSRQHRFAPSESSDCIIGRILTATLTVELIPPPPASAPCRAPPGWAAIPQQRGRVAAMLRLASLPIAVFTFRLVRGLAHVTTHGLWKLASKNVIRGRGAHVTSPWRCGRLLQEERRALLQMLPARVFSRRAAAGTL